MGQNYRHNSSILNGRVNCTCYKYKINNSKGVSGGINKIMNPSLYITINLLDLF